MIEEKLEVEWYGKGILEKIRSYVENLAYLRTTNKKEKTRIRNKLVQLLVKNS